MLSMPPRIIPTNDPLVSIITVCFNSREGLKKTISSVINQDFDNFEYIIIDGGSTDGSIELIQSFEPHIATWITEPDRGIYHAMNKGLKLAKGKYVHFLNAGDEFLNAGILSQMAPFFDQHPNLLMNQVIAVDPKSGQQQLLPKSFGHRTVRELFRSAYCHQAAFVQRAAYLEMGGFDEGFPHFADFKAIYMIRQTMAAWIENPIPIVKFPLDGATSDWHRAPSLFKEQEMLMTFFNDHLSYFSYYIGLFRAHLYRIKMHIKLSISTYSYSL